MIDGVHHMHLLGRPTHRETADNGSGDENGKQVLGMDIDQTHLLVIFLRLFVPTTNAAVGNKLT